MKEYKVVYSPYSADFERKLNEAVQAGFVVEQVCMVHDYSALLSKEIKKEEK